MSSFPPLPLQREMLRKALHLLIALVPLLAARDKEATLILLGAGTLLYALAESSRRKGRPVLIISDLTLLVSRDPEERRFVLGPLTLGLGAMLSLLLYPCEAAAAAIYAVAFGDGLAGLTGGLIRTPAIPFTCRKTVAGSLACFSAVAFSSWRLAGGNLPMVLGIAAVATVLEMASISEFDNLLLPVGAGFAATVLI